MVVDFIWGNVVQRGNKSPPRLYGMDIRFENNRLLWVHSMYSLLTGQVRGILARFPQAPPPAQNAALAYVVHESIADECLRVPYSQLFEVCRQKGLSFDIVVCLL